MKLGKRKRSVRRNLAAGRRNELPVISHQLEVRKKKTNCPLKLVDETSIYALTGSIFSTDRHAAAHATKALQNCAGNFYINDKCTGAVVGQQPFGGARGSGTNDKAGSHMNMLRWTSPRTIKETFVPATDYRYPFLG